MQRVIYLLSLLALPILLLLSVAVSMVELGSAQNPNCVGANRCETFVSNGGGAPVRGALLLTKSKPRDM
jgi:hypothetical protein